MEEEGKGLEGPHEDIDEEDEDIEGGGRREDDTDVEGEEIPAQLMDAMKQKPDKEERKDTEKRRSTR